MKGIKFGAIQEPFLAALASVVVGASSFSIGYHVFLTKWPNPQEQPFTPQPKVTFVSAKKKMEEFIKGIKSDGTDQQIVLSQVPIPGNTMVWSHPEDYDFWQSRSKVLKTNPNSDISIPYEIDKLQKWCNSHMSIRLYVKKVNGKPKFKSSIDGKEYVDQVSQVTALNNVKTNCARLVTVEEFHEEKMSEKDGDKWITEKCDELARKDYTSQNAKDFSSKCLKQKGTKKEK